MAQWPAGNQIFYHKQHGNGTDQPGPTNPTPEYKMLTKREQWQATGSRQFF
jgi:hypothetical protein